MPKQDLADQSTSEEDFDEFAELVGTKKPTLSDKIQILSKKIMGKPRKLKARWTIENPKAFHIGPGGLPIPKGLARKLRDRYGPK